MDHRPFMKRGHRVGQDVGTASKQYGYGFARMDERPTARRGVIAGYHNQQVSLIGDSLDNRTERSIERLKGLHFAQRVFVMGRHVRGLGMDMHEFISWGKEGLRGS